MAVLRCLFAGLALTLAALTTGCGTEAPATPHAGLPLACAWPFESDGRGITNVATPETHATYWVMPFAVLTSQTMVLHGRYPRARFFNISSYAEGGSVLDSLPDSRIAPDPGSTNPFATGTSGGPGSYTVTIGPAQADATGTASGNRLSTGTGKLAFVVIRIYLPNRGQDNTGGVGLPTVTLTEHGATRTLPPCPFTSAEVAVGNLAILLATNGFSDAARFMQVIQTAFRQTPSSPPGSCILTRPGSGAVSFATSGQGSGFFPNPQATYFATSGLCMRPNQVLVVRGRAPVYPNTYEGGSVLQPAFDGRIQLRYWSLCNNFAVIPNPVIACAADVETAIGPDQFYTYVLSNDRTRPSWLPSGATWLPWGERAIPKSLMFRQITEQTPPLQGDYTPRGAICDQSLFIRQGWEGCFGATGVI